MLGFTTTATTTRPITSADPTPLRGVIGVFDPNKLNPAALGVEERPPDSDERLLWRGAPLWRSASGRWTFVGELRLDNGPELRTALGLAEDVPDGVAFAELMARQGVGGLLRASGMFAGAAFDRQWGRVYLLRDAVGARTLYYRAEGQRVWFASHLDALEQAVPARRQVSLTALRNYLAYAFVPGSETMWEDFREVPPGRALAFPEGSTQTYWEPRECIEAPEAQDLAIRSAELRALLFDVVVRNLPASGPIGVYLSGGLDSSLVTAILAKLAPGRVHSYAVHFGAGYPNELQFSDAVARHCATNHHVIEIPIASIRDALLTTHAALSNPIGDPLTCPNFILGRTAARDTNVIFNGEGGDPCFGGPKNMPMLLHQLHAGAHGGESVESAYLRSYQKCYDDLDRLLRPEVRAALEAAPPQEELLRPFFEGDAMSSFLNRLMHINVRVKGADNILTKVNDLTTANGLLGISPLFDRRVVDFSFSAPPRFKLDGATEKAVLKRAVVDLLPESVVYRPKSGMMVPVQRWFKRELREIAQDWLLGKDGRVAEFLDTAVVRRWLEFRGELFPRQGAKLWLALGLEAWLRAHERR